MSNDPYEISLDRKRAVMHGQVLTKREWQVVRAALRTALALTASSRKRGMQAGRYHEHCKRKEAEIAAVLARCPKL